MLNFQNNSLNIDELPRFETVEKHSISVQYLKVLRITYVVFLLILSVALASLFLFSEIYNSVFYVLVGLVIFVYSFLILEIEKGFKNRKYGLREKDILFQKGFLVFKETIVPYKRIQHVEVKQGLLFKAFNIYSLKLFTAGSSLGDLKITGLEEEQIDKIKAQILKLSDIDED